MFNVIAPRYDQFTRVFSFGMDRRWKEYILRRITAADLNEGAILDLACGTGDFSFALAGTQPRRTVVGLDVAANMIDAARTRAMTVTAAHSENLPSFVLGDIMLLPVRDGRVALVTASYAFRNVPDFRLALRRLASLMPAGALLVSLDFYLPPSTLWRTTFLAYLRIAGKLIGWMWHRSPEVYEYISHSIRHFVSADEFARELKAAGFVVEHEKRWLGGGIASHFARKQGS